VEAATARMMARATATLRCACDLYSLSGVDECVDDQNRKVHTVARCGFGVPCPSPAPRATDDDGKETR
jgi:hypothetical protein